MDTLSVVGSVYTTAAGLLLPQVKCCVCGILIDSNPSNMCVKCIQTHVNITEGMLNEYILTYCPECERWLQPPKYWSRAALDSRELMTICIKKIRGLGRFNLVDARFIWTEPHSKRLKLLLTLQKELFANAVVQQSMQIEYIVQWRQCEMCAKVATGQPQWDAVVQLRQKAEHKRTFLYLEQLVLKHRMHENTIRIDSHPDGLDFFFGHKSHGNAFVEFINMNAPMQRTDASQLVSHDSKSNTAVQHHTFSIELAPICREDIICLPKKLHAAMGGFGPIVLVHKVYSSIVFVDPQTLRASELESNIYWKNRFNSLANTRRMTIFFVLNVVPTGVVNGKMVQADITVCLESEVGGDREWTVRSHLGAVLKEGDLCKGYQLSAVNHNDENIAQYPVEAVPDVVLVHKHYDNQARRRNKRQWELRQLDISEGTGTGAKRAVAERERDMEDFKDDLERDPEFRKDVQLYRVAPKGATVRNVEGLETTGAQILVGAAAAAAVSGKRADDTQSEAGDEETVAVDLAELMDDLADMRISGARHGRDEAPAADEADADEANPDASA